jgi:cold shock CspA family protein
MNKPARKRGTVKLWRGNWGIVTDLDSGADSVVYFEAIQSGGYRELIPGEPVTYEIEADPRNPGHTGACRLFRCDPGFDGSNSHE